MALVNIAFDTNSKELSVSIDGTKLDDVKYITLYNWEEEKASISIELKPKETDGMRIYTSVNASVSSGKYEFVKYVDEERSLACLEDKQDFHKKIADFIMKK